VADDQVDTLGETVGRLPFVSHCYRRPRRLPLWPYNLFAMVHAKNREQAQAYADQISTVLGGACRQSDILYSSRMLKKTGLRISD
jgi:DNA-binding Lrp family transcriptional regulator